MLIKSLAEERRGSSSHLGNIAERCRTVVIVIWSIPFFSLTHNGLQGSGFLIGIQNGIQHRFSCGIVTCSNICSFGASLTVKSLYTKFIKAIGKSCYRLVHIKSRHIPLLGAVSGINRGLALPTSIASIANTKAGS